MGEWNGRTENRDVTRQSRSVDFPSRDRVRTNRTTEWDTPFSMFLARTYTRRVISSFCRFASTSSPLRSTEATATNRVYVFPSHVHRLTYTQVQRQRSHVFGKPFTSKNEERILPSRLTLVLLRRLRETLYSCLVQSA